MRHFLLAGLCLAFAATRLNAQAPAILTAQPVKVHALTDRAYWVESPIGNAGFVIGDTGVIAIDALMFPSMSRDELTRMARITDKPVNTMILSHADPDHINGLISFPRGMKVIAQQNTLAAFRAKMTKAAPSVEISPPGTSAYMPTAVVKDRLSTVIDGVTLELIHIAPAHTDGDLIVYVPSEHIVFAGDILTPELGAYPVIHVEERGSAIGWIATVRAMLQLDARIFVSGHGDLVSSAALRNQLTIVEKRRNEVASLVKQGKNLAEIKAALHDERWPGFAARFPTFVEVLYGELKPGRPTQP